MTDPRKPGEENELLRRLPLEAAPPPELEDRVVDALLSRDLLRGRNVARGSRASWRGGLLRAAAVVALLGAGFVTGRLGALRPSEGGTGGEVAAARYALLLYETEEFRPASGAEEAARYHEYSHWVAWAREREQFVTGEDLAVDEGRVLTPAGEGPTVESGVAPKERASLSGVFLIEASDLDDAVELARRLPHLEHGGQVVVQRVVPTDRLPDADRSDGADSV